jgi:YD repeat-containing protein
LPTGFPSITDPLQHLWRFGYTGTDLVSTTDPLNAINYRFVDGRAARADDACNGGKLNRVTAVVDAISAQTQVADDPNGRVLSLINALAHATGYTYDANDRIATRRDPVVNYQYDTLDRLTQVNAASGVGRAFQARQATLKGSPYAVL